MTGLLISVDRMERVDSGLSALKNIEKEFNIPTASIVSILDIIEFISSAANRETFSIAEESLGQIIAYREKYGA